MVSVGFYLPQPIIRNIANGVGRVCSSAVMGKKVPVIPLSGAGFNPIGVDEQGVERLPGGGILQDDINIFLNRGMIQGHVNVIDFGGAICICVRNLTGISWPVHPGILNGNQNICRCLTGKQQR
jgi:hypothetical protein